MSQEELSYISILEGLTGALAVDCILEKNENRVIFVVRRNDTGKVIGRGGTTIQRLRDHFKRNIEVVEYADKIERFTINTLSPAKTKKVEVIERSGQKTVVVTVIPKEKGKAIGKNGRNIHRSRMLLKRHFGVENVIIQSMN
jgi:N utilization substance protein A